VTETYRVIELAELIAKETGVEIAHLPNPRREAVENDLNVSRERFIALGLDAITLTEGLLEEIRDVANKYSYRADTTKIIARSVWKQGMETSPDLVS
jgi:UDP-sulfoquinovose synthase